MSRPRTDTGYAGAGLPLLWVGIANLQPPKRDSYEIYAGHVPGEHGTLRSSISVTERDIGDASYGALHGLRALASCHHTLFSLSLGLTPRFLFASGTSEIVHFFSPLSKLAGRAVHFAGVNFFLFYRSLETIYLRIHWTDFRDLCTK